MFDVDRYIALVFQFFTGNIFIAIGSAVILIFFIYRKPVATVKFFGFVALIVAVLYVMSLLTESGSLGVKYKSGGIEKSEEQLPDE